MPEMFALGIRYLNGWATASDVANRDQVEWPPHPGRIFMAMAAAYFHNEKNPGEQAALEWLEKLDPPEVYAGGCEARRVVTHFVPVNDKPGPAKAVLQSAPGLTRTRQPRTFARAWLSSDTVYLVWPEVTAKSSIAENLAKLTQRVSRIGHSSSLVQMWMESEPPANQSALVPDDSRADRRFRVPTPGTLRYLEERYNGGALEAYGALKVAELEALDKKTRAKIRKELRETYQNQPPVSLRPELSQWQGYALAKPESPSKMPGTFFDPNLLIYRLIRESGSYRSLELATTLRLTTLLRKAMVRVASGQGRPLPESIIGHRPNGLPSESPHMAMLPLGFVGSEYADGKLMGIALALPRDLTTVERKALLVTLAAIKQLKLGSLGVWRLEAPSEDRPPYSLLSSAWTAATAGATEWGSITPIVLDRHAKAKDPAAYRDEVTGIIRRSCQRVTDQEPAHIIIGSVSPHLGTPPAHAFPRLQRKDGSDLCHTHATLIFNRPIIGPLFLGAGRYRGYGFCRPTLKVGSE